MTNIFISYRRDDSEQAAGRLYDSLKKVLKPYKTKIFYDYEGIHGGQDFNEKIQKEIESSHIFILVIGQRFGTLKDEFGVRRIAKEEDVFAKEISLALELEKTIIPVLVNDGQIPDPSTLPERIRKITDFQGVRLMTSQWERGIEELKDDIDSNHKLRRRWPLKLTIPVIVVLLMGAYFIFDQLNQSSWSPDDPTGEWLVYVENFEYVIDQGSERIFNSSTAHWNLSMREDSIATIRGNVDTSALIQYKWTMNDSLKIINMTGDQHSFDLKIIESGRDKQKWQSNTKYSNKRIAQTWNLTRKN